MWGVRLTLTALALAVLAAPASAHALNNASTVVPQGVKVEETKGKFVRVFVLLVNQPLIQEAQGMANPGWVARQGASKARSAARRSPYVVTSAEHVVAGRIEARRQEALTRLNVRVPNTQAQQAELAREIKKVGGRPIKSHVLPNGLVASIPKDRVANIQALPYVQAIRSAPKPEKQLNIGVPSTGVNLPGSWWPSGFTGGTADIGILTDEPERTHPWFSGITFDEPPGQTQTSTDHGSMVSSVVVSQDATYRGIAYGLDKFLDAANLGNTCDTGGSEEVWVVGLDQNCDYGQGQLISGAVDPAEALNKSSGNVATNDDGSMFFDSLVDIAGVGMAAAAGNQGPGAETVNTPSTSYNVISVGSTATQGTTSRADDTIPDYSSRGPVPTSGRKKPDIVAPGKWLYVACYSYPNPPCPNPGTGEEGTSLSSPMVAGALVLLASAGVTDPRAQKAILINSADPVGAQTDWQADAGWGQLAMETAFTERGFYELGSVAGDGAKFYSANLAAGDKATLVWHRRIVFEVMPPNMQTPKTVYTTTNLDLTQYTTAQAQKDTSASSIDNVEQVKAPDAEQAVYKVKASSTVDGTPTELFALAASKALTVLETPTVTQLNGQSKNEIKQGTDVAITSTVTNTSDDLTAGTVSAEINLPAGVSLVGGAQSQNLGVLNANQSGVANWTIRGTTDGQKAISIQSSGSSFGELWTSIGNLGLLVDSTPPTTAFGSLGAYTTSNPLTISLTSSDGPGTGVSQTEVQVSTNSGAWQAHTTLPAGQNSFSFTGVEGSSYRFRSRATDDLSNTGDWAYSSTTTIDTQAPSLSLYALPTSTFGQPVTVWVAATDAVSGIATKTYSVDGGGVVGFSGDVLTVSGLSPGYHAVAVSVADAAGHVSTQAVGVTIMGVTVDPKPKQKTRVGKLKIKRKGRKITVRGTITKGVSGKVRITAKFYGKKPRSKKLKKKIKKATKAYAKIKKRRFRKTFKVPARGRYKIVAKFRGNDSFKASKRTRRIRVR